MQQEEFLSKMFSLKESEAEILFAFGLVTPLDTKEILRARYGKLRSNPFIVERVREHHERLFNALTPEQWAMWRKGCHTNDDSDNWHEVRNTITGYMDFEEVCDELTAEEKAAIRVQVLAA
jgi:hypothetical protein